MNSKNLAESLIALVNDGMSERDALAKFFDYVQANNLEFQLPQVLRHLERISREEQDFESVQVQTPFPLDDGAVNAIKTKLGAGDAQVSVSEHPDLIGGFRAMYKGMLYDASMQNVLKQLQGQLEK
jgi:F0F1-type ATP synthase delta subunit